MKIDWSKAPEGSTHYAHETEDQYAAWYKEVGGRWMVWIVDGGYAWRLTACLPSDAIARPAEWDGTGLPPVGTECEGNEYGEWVKLEIIAHYEGRAVCMLPCKERVALADPGQIRPIRNPEQTAAEERKKACDEMLEIAKSSRPDPNIYEVIGALYAAGYRKTEQENGR